MWTLFALAGIATFAGSTFLRQDSTTPSASTSDKRLDSLTAAWNSLSADKQFEVCASVHTKGLDATADDVQRAANQFSTAAHDDVTFFLDYACN
jgi:hypothetical protein